jgi:D-3-phosphoglycerate dehydrogenase
MSYKCLIADVVHPNIKNLLAGINVDYTYQPDISRTEIIHSLAGYDGLIIRSKTRVDAELLEHADQLKFVARPGSGIDNIDVAYMLQNNIEIINAPEGNRDAVGDHTLGLVLNLLNNIQIGHNQVIAGIWDRAGNRGEEIGYKTIGIIGYGNTGRAFAKRLSGLGCHVIAYDKFKTNYGDQFATAVDLPDIFKNTDILSLHIPLSEANYHLANVDFFNRFTRNIYFINTSRGELAPLADLVAAIRSGKIKKAALDVLECEQFSQLSSTQKEDLDWLRQSGKVLFTPHVAGWSNESYEKLNTFMVEKIQFLLAKLDSI